MKIIAIIVLYNRRLELSPSFQSAIHQPDVQLLVVDNSTIQDVRNQEEAVKAGAWFLSMKGNNGLSRAYNAAFNYLRFVEADWIVLLDDDTCIPDDYWHCVRCHNPNAILLPIVKSEIGKILSPADMSKGVPVAVRHYQDIKTITGINSGMAIPKHIAENYRYSEDLFLDFVDHKFMADMHLLGYPVIVLQCELIQHFSADYHSFQDAAVRFSIQKKDIRSFYRKSPWKGEIILIKRKIRLAINTRDVRALFL